jgi:hypothetical protein
LIFEFSERRSTQTQARLQQPTLTRVRCALPVIRPELVPTMATIA